MPCSGFCLAALRRLQAFLASSACSVSATSYHFASIAPPPWHSAFSQFAPCACARSRVYRQRGRWRCANGSTSRSSGQHLTWA
ncbi:MAG: DUF1010 domain-containing protein [Comamonadaceae bacterium]|nr:DUF1010 domain-containing protein [Comamonadaceae bacterium]